MISLDAKTSATISDRDFEDEVECLLELAADKGYHLSAVILAKGPCNSIFTSTASNAPYEAEARILECFITLATMAVKHADGELRQRIQSVLNLVREAATEVGGKSGLH